MRTSIIVVCLLLSIANLSFAMYEGNTKVQKLTVDNFNSKVINSNEVWFVEFYAPWCGHCKNLAPSWEKLAKALDGIINIGAVDMTTDQAAGSPYGVSGFPTLKFFGADKSKAIDYSGNRDFDDLLNYAFREARTAAETRIGSKGKSGGNAGGGHGGHGGGNEAVSDKDVVILTDDNFDSTVYGSDDIWLIEFYAPWCGHCKNLEPHWSKAATELKGEVKIAKVDSTVHTKIAQEFGVKGYPTIKWFPPGKKTTSSAEDYTGGRDASAIIEFAKDKKASYKPAHKVDQITNQEYFDDICIKIKGMCIIAFLPHIYDSSAAERNAEIEILQDIQKLNKLNPITIIWAQAGDHYNFEESLSLGSGYPSIVAIHTGKMKYGIMKGAFNRRNVEAWVTNLVNGKEPLNDLRQLVKVSAVEKWDGLDHKPSYSDEV